MRHLRTGGALLAWCLVAGWTPAANGATDPECLRFAVRGVALGMRPADVRSRLGVATSVGTVPGASGRQTSVTHTARDLVIEVMYDRDILEDPDARVVLVHARGPARVADPAAFVRSIVSSLGEPVEGGQHLENGLVYGSTVWRDEACGVEITAYREKVEWWRPGERDVAVRIVSTGSTTETEVAQAVPPTLAPAPELFAAASEPDREPQLGNELEQIEPEIQLATEPEAPPEPDPVPRAADAPETFTGPSLITSSQVEPRYPLRAMVLRITASVSLRVQVKRDGSVGDVTVLDTTRKSMGFEQSAIEAVKKWRYTPAMRNGNAEVSAVTVRVTFD